MFKPLYILNWRNLTSLWLFLNVTIDPSFLQKSVPLRNYLGKNVFYKYHLYSLCIDKIDFEEKCQAYILGDVNDRAKWMAYKFWQTF